jgi:hypothetical protein
MQQVTSPVEGSRLTCTATAIYRFEPAAHRPDRGRACAAREPSWLATPNEAASSPVPGRSTPGRPGARSGSRVRGRVRVRISNRCSRRARSVVASGSSFQFTPGGRSAPARSLTGRWAAGGCSSARRRSLPRAARWVPQSRPRVADARGRDERIRWVAPGRRPGHRSNKIRLVMMCPLLGTQVLWEGTVH